MTPTAPLAPFPPLNPPVPLPLKYPASSPPGAVNLAPFGAWLGTRSGGLCASGQRADNGLCAGK